jgi:hypothetical protein
VSTRVFGKSLLATAASAVGVLALSAVPAAATTGSGGGFVKGTVGFTPGIPTGNVCASQAIQFQSIAIVGAFTAGISVAAGTFVAIASGGTSAYPLPLPPPIGCAGAQENAFAGAGTINPFLFAGGGVGAVTANCAGGSYLHLGSIGAVSLTCDVFVNGIKTHFNDLKAIGSFRPSPTDGNGVTSPITQADFDGAFAGIGS